MHPNRRTAIKHMLAGAASLPFARSVAAMPSTPVRAKRMLFLGGTGFLGPHMVRSAIEQGYHITLFRRGRAGLELFPDAERLTGDRGSDLSALQGKTWDVVIDNSGYVPADVRASATLLRDSVGHYVYTSTIDAYRDFREPNIAEDYPLARLPEGAPHNPGRYYGPLKALCEAEVSAVFPGKCTIIRPGWVVGPGDTNHLFTYWVMRIRQGGELIAPGTPTDPVQMVDARDLGAFVIRMADGRVAGAFTAVRSPMSFGEMLAAIATGVGTTIQPVWVDADWLNTKGIKPYFDMPLWYPPRNDYNVPNMPSGLNGGVGAFRMSGAKAARAGLTHRSVADSARDTLAWYETEHKGVWPEKGRPGLTRVREQAFLAEWKSTRR
jgi:2'-hydroxyisoflavone reductase